MYFVEGNQQNFSTIPKSLWWAVITFTSVGYGDVTPITPWGKVIASITAILGIGLHGVLISVFGAGFFEEVMLQILNGCTPPETYFGKSVLRNIIRIFLKRSCCRGVLYGCTLPPETYLGKSVLRNIIRIFLKR